MRRSSAGFILAVVLSSTCAATSWTANGPDGGAILSATADGGALRIGTTDGVYIFDAIDSRWSRLGDLPRGVWTRNIAVSPINPSLILAAGSDQTYRSVDGGSHWVGTNQSLEHIVFHPSAPNEIVATDTDHLAIHRASSDGEAWIDEPLNAADVAADSSQSRSFYMLKSDSEALYRSTNSGFDWSSYGDLPSGGYQKQLVIDPFDNGKIFWAESNLDVRYIKRFEPISGMFEVSFGADSISAFLADPTTAGRFWTTALSPSSVEFHLYETVDHGDTWSDLGPIDSTPVNADPQIPGMIYGKDARGFTISRDAGRTWNSMTKGIPLSDVATISIRPDAPEEILVGGAGFGVALSIDGGTTWTGSNGGITNTQINTVMRSPINSKDVYAGSDDGLFHSIDGGRNWLAVNINNFPRTGRKQFTYMDVDHDNPELLVAVIGYNELAWSDDAGKNWRDAISNGSSDLRIIGRSYAGSRRVYALAWQSGPDYQLYRSEVHGGTLAPTSGDIAITAFAVHPSDDRILFALGRAGGGWTNWQAYLSYDAGESWQLRGLATLPQPIVGEPQVRFDPCDAQTVYVLDGSSFYISHDQGLTWSEDTIAIPSFELNDVDARCNQGRISIATATKYAGAQIRAAMPVDRIYANGFDLN